MAQIIDGKQVSARMREDIRRRVETVRDRGVIPGLAVVLVGDNPASHSYVKAKEAACGDVGIRSFDRRLPSDITEADLLAEVAAFRANPDVDGILVQLPLPHHISEERITDAIGSEKDVDGFHPENLGRMLLGRPRFLPCTPFGVMKLLETIGIDPAGKEVVIVGRSNIVGKPLASMLVQKARGANATVTVCHTATERLEYHTKRADILIAAAGKAGCISGDMIKPQAVVIDVGVNRVEDASRKSGYRLVGDVDFSSAERVASWITPVPGGVGPMTITMLLSNTVDSAESRASRPADG
ncbi:MAG: bifunctional methylenetetrahydrofolate dehydrogenase/methenyltetrahydrofolate cyclohydrolase FolD [Spirochaetaceae bacterium]|nr:MAG: bifunctional methylenetetrahydrofolate dehydrogenase/methenyltetrahydrofolate cyclohydrolase FolD [Spirochaetaceae bacterium]